MSWFLLIQGKMRCNTEIFLNVASLFYKNNSYWFITYWEIFNNFINSTSLALQTLVSFWLQWGHKLGMWAQACCFSCEPLYLWGDQRWLLPVLSTLESKTLYSAGNKAPLAKWWPYKHENLCSIHRTYFLKANNEAYSLNPAWDGKARIIS